MKLLNEFWNDEYGFLLSSEAVCLGTIGVVAALVGLNALSKSVDAELKETAAAIRSLDQSYAYLGFRSNHAWTAGSAFRQQEVAVSLQQLDQSGSRTPTLAPTVVMPRPAIAPVDDVPTPCLPNRILVPADQVPQDERF